MNSKISSMQEGIIVFPPQTLFILWAKFFCLIPALLLFSCLLYDGIAF